jgi:hypothetical protein
MSQPRRPHSSRNLRSPIPPETLPSNVKSIRFWLGVVWPSWSPLELGNVAVQRKAGGRRSSCHRSSTFAGPPAIAPS